MNSLFAIHFFSFDIFIPLELFNHEVQSFAGAILSQGLKIRVSGPDQYLVFKKVGIGSGPNIQIQNSFKIMLAQIAFVQSHN